MENSLEIPENFEFPYQPYQIQLEFMKNLYECIERRQLGIFESPTGTGKSLSIICGAIRWLKDHNRRKKDSLDQRIAKLQLEKEELVKSSNDWLTTQSKEIELNYTVNNLKLELKKIQDYEARIEKLQKEARSKNLASFDTKDNSSTIQTVDNSEDDDELLLQETTDGNQSDNADSDDDRNEQIYENTKIFICSRTHSQLSQFIGEINKSPFAKDCRVSILASRQTFCINPTVKQLKNNNLINEKCLDLQNRNAKKSDKDGKLLKKRKDTCKCPYYKQNSIEKLRNTILTDVHDIEDLVKTSRNMTGCPYYASRLAAKDAEIVLVPYQTILHKPTREANGIKLKNNVLIIDEAHNLLETMAQIHSCELNSQQIRDALQQLKLYKNRFSTKFSAFNLLNINQLIFILNKIDGFLQKFAGDQQQVYKVEEFVITAEIDNFNMFKLTKFCKDSRIAQKIRNYSIKYPDDSTITPAKTGGVKEFLKNIKKSGNTTQTVEDKTEKLITTPLLPVITFLESLTYNYKDARIFCNNHHLQFFLLNPSENFREIIRETRSMIVAGGTMQPINEFRQRLFINCGVEKERIVEFSCNHIIPPDNILPIILTKGPKDRALCFNYETRTNMIDSVKTIILECCQRISGGIVVFFPSYNYENLVYNELKNVEIKQQIFREPKQSNQVEYVLKQYADVVGKTKRALLLSVVGGKLSEGLNFNDDLGRCIIVVGLPYANYTALDLREKMAYLDRTEGTGAGRSFYVNLCMKAVNQSIGRAVRHKNDYATILLIDERYNCEKIKNLLPNWIQKSLKICSYNETFDNIVEFFSNKNQ